MFYFEKSNKRDQEELDKLVEKLKSPSNQKTFGQIFDKAVCDDIDRGIEWTKSFFALAVMRDESSFCRLRKAETKYVSLKLLMRICIGMQFPFEVCLILFSAAGYSLNNASNPDNSRILAILSYFNNMESYKIQSKLDKKMLHVRVEIYETYMAQYLSFEKTNP